MMYKIIKVTTMNAYYGEDDYGRETGIGGWDYAGHRMVVVPEDRLDEFYECLASEFDCDSKPEDEIVGEFTEFELKQIVQQAAPMLKNADEKELAQINKAIAELLS